MTEAGHPTPRMAAGSRGSKSLAELVAGFAHAPADILVNDVTLDSRAASPGSLFLACRGRSHHGLKFARQAVAQGARAVFYEEAVGSERDPVSGSNARDSSSDVRGSDPDIHGSTQAALAQMASELGSAVFVAAVPQLSHRAGTIADRFFGEPSRTLTVAGITGTNGKTTCAWLLAQALQQCGRPAAYMGTLGFGLPPSVTATQHTTSDAVSVHRQLATLKDLGAGYVCMEVSSHAIDQDRVAAVRFNSAAFTNLTRDHLDYHGTMDAYGAVKARLFEWPSLANCIINVDDAFGAQIAAQLSPAGLVITSRSSELPGGVVSSLRHAQFVRAIRATPEAAGLAIEVESSWGRASLTVPLIGEFNVDNVLTVLAVLLAWNIPLEKAIAALAACRAPSGRMEMFGGQASTPLAIVDYAHTPDALAKALRAARMHCKARLRVVFGCGGDRDPGKRPLMGRVAAELADDLIVTDDNPRTEDPAAIVADILKGIGQPASLLVEHDRARAIRIALQRSGSGDVVLVAGKGHEDYQIYGTLRRVFRDQDVVRETLQGVRP